MAKVKITVDLDDLLEVVNKYYEVEEHNFENDEDHIVHVLRRLSSRINGDRLISDGDSERMTYREYQLYTKGMCSHVVEYGTVLGRIVHCKEPVKRVRTGTLLERSSCPEHVRDVLDGY